MEVIITAATVATMFFNVANSSVENGLKYNAQMNGNKIETINVYNVEGNYLSNKMQYSYKYDAQDRLTKKIAQKWNSLSRSWENAYEINYNYTATGYILSRANWNEKKEQFDMAQEAISYEILGDYVVAMKTYKLDNDSKDYALVDKMLVMNPNDDMLFALAEENMK